MAKNTIKIKKYSDVIEEFTATAAAITPGMLLVQDSAGLVKAHNVAGGNVVPMFALEDELQGKLITDNYANSAKVQVWIPYRGDIVLAILADGENVAIGDALESDGAGKLRKHTPTVDSAADVETIYGNSIVGYAVEAVDMSGSAGADPSGRIQVRIV